MESLAVKYRPHKFEDVCSQTSVIKILQKQLETKQFTNCYLFAGPSGCGKTTLARIFANEINGGKGEPIEIDGASNNGVDNVRVIIDQANARALDCEYKVFIIDECHAISGPAWQAFLKTIEEPPQYTIFMFCTTDPQKLPVAIQNRIMKFNLTKVNIDLIKNRLLYICQKEGYANYRESCDYIAKLSEGGARDAISMLEKCANYSTDLCIDNVLNCVGNFSYDSFFNLTGAFVNCDEASVMQIVNEFYNSGKDLKQFVDFYLDFVLDLTKYCIFRDMSVVKIPESLGNRCAGYASIPDIKNYSDKLVDAILDVKFKIAGDNNAKTTIEALFVRICRGL